MKPNVFFRADGNAEIGLGHVIRSLALAHILKEDFECIFLIQDVAEFLKNEILKTCTSIISLNTTLNYAEEAVYISHTFINAGDILVLDGYNFKTEYQQTLKNKGIKLVCIDDLYQWHFVADAIINQNPSIKASFYSKENYTKLYIGFDFLLLRKCFIEEIRNSREIVKVENAFICIGGADPANITEIALRAALKTASFSKINVVTGGAYKHIASLKMLVTDNPDIVKHYTNLTADEMLSLIKSSEFAIAPASSISMELLCVGVNLLTGYFVDNQKKFSEYMHNVGLGYSLGNLNEVSESLWIKCIKENLYNGTYKTQKKILEGVDEGKLKFIFKNL